MATTAPGLDPAHHLEPPRPDPSEGDRKGYARETVRAEKVPHGKRAKTSKGRAGDGSHRKRDTSETGHMGNGPPPPQTERPPAELEGEPRTGPGRLGTILSIPQKNAGNAPTPDAGRCQR